MGSSRARWRVNKERTKKPPSPPPPLVVKPDEKTSPKGSKIKRSTEQYV